MSTMDLDELLRMGIAEAQVATVARAKRDQQLHLHRARGLLLAALRRCGPRDPDLRMHLLAVLLKLGEDARSVTGLLAEGVDRKDSEPVANSSGPTRASGSSELEEQSEDAEVSEHSSAEAGQDRAVEYDEMRESLLEDSDDDAEELLSPTRVGAPPQDLGSDTSAIAPLGEEADSDTLDSTALLGPKSLGIPEESEEDAASTPIESPAVKTQAALVGASLEASDCKASSAVELSTAIERLEQHMSDDRRISMEMHAADEGVSPKHPPAHGSEHSWLRSSRSSATSQSSLVQQTSWPVANVVGQLSQAPASVPSGCESSSSETRESLNRLRAHQPQQAGRSQWSVKRRQAKSMPATLEHQGAESKLVSSPLLVARHSGRQPSQSSSSGSQGAMSDSEGSAVAKRASMPLASAIIKEEPDSINRGLWSTSGHKFEPPARSGAAFDEDWADNVAVKGSPDSVSASVEDPSLAEEAKTPKQSVSPMPRRLSREIASSDAGAHADLGARSKLEKAVPSAENDIRNPLSQPELFSNGDGTPVISSVHASPATDSAQSRSSVASWSLAGSAAQSGTPSPFFENAVASAGTADEAPPLMPVSPTEKVSVRILNGVSGEEEVRFPVPVEASFSEQHFFQMLDRLCQKKTGQALSDLNWLSQAHPGARFQRRKCDMSMVEELFGDGGSQSKGPTVILLCTVPARPPSELPANKVRLRNLTPARVTCGAVLPVRLQLDTTVLETGHQYTVAFTHQCSYVTYAVEATLMENQRGVELNVPWQMLVASGSNTDGLYDVHLVTDHSFRSENRRTITVGSAESEFSSSSTAMSAAQSSFVPLGKNTSTPKIF